MKGPATNRAGARGEDPPDTSRAAWVVQTFVELASTLITDFDLVEVLSVLTDRGFGEVTESAKIIPLAGGGTARSSRLVPCTPWT